MLLVVPTLRPHERYRLAGAPYWLTLRTGLVGTALVRNWGCTPSRKPQGKILLGEGGLLVFVLDLKGRVGTQPQGDVGGLHRLPYHSY